MVRTHASRRTSARILAALTGVTVVWGTVLMLQRGNPVDLTVALLVVLAEVLLVAVLSGTVLAVLVAVAAVVLVNWYLVPPYGTFEIENTENVTALFVFILVATVAAALMAFATQAQARAQTSAGQAELLGEVVDIDSSATAASALERIRVALDLDEVSLLRSGGGGTHARRVATTALPAARRPGASPVAGPSLDVAVGDGYRLIGHGRQLFAPDPDFLTSLGSAAVLAYESERLDEESRRAEHLAAIDRSRTALLASVGHDLRTPLASLKVCVDALRDSAAQLSDDERTELLATIAGSSDRLDELISNLLDMSRLQAGAVIAQLQPTDVSEVLARVLLAGHDARLEVYEPDAPPAVVADPVLLERVVANLVSNALRHSPDGSSVQVLIAQRDRDLVLEVRDHGPGISQAEREDAFLPFHRVAGNSGGDGGSGLGLAIVRGFADAMAVRVELAETSGGGLTARVRMPIWTEQQGAQ